jgi:hypothetical protein
MSNASPAAVVPGKTLGIIALIVSFLVSVVGVVLGFVARNQSKAAGVKNGPATAAIIIGFVALGLQVLVIVAGPLILTAIGAAIGNSLVANMPAQ